MNRVRMFVLVPCALALTAALSGCRGADARAGDTVFAQARGKDLLKWAESPTTRPREGQSVPTRTCFVGRVVEVDKKDGASESRLLIRVERWVVGGGAVGGDPVAVLFALDDWKEKYPSAGERWVIGCWMTGATDTPVFRIDTACAQYPAIPVDAVVN